MDTRILDEFFEMGEKGDSTDYDKIMLEFRDILKAYSPEELIDYINLKGLEEDYIEVFFREDERLHDIKYIPAILDFYKENKISLYVFKDIFKDTNLYIDETMIEQVKETFGEKLYLIYDILPSKHQTDELFSEWINYKVDSHMEKGYSRVASNDVSEMINGIDLSIPKLDLLVEALKKANYDENMEVFRDSNLVSIVWKNQKKKSPELLNYLLANFSEKLDKKTIYSFLIRNTSPDNEECIKILFQNYYNELSSDEINKKIKRFNDLCLIDCDFYKTINITCLEDEFNIFNVEQLIRISSDSELIDSIIYERTPNEKDFSYSIIKKIVEEDEGIYEKLSILNECRKNYGSHLLYNAKEKPELLNKLIQIMLRDPNNMFEVKELEDITNYENKRKQICLSILEESSADFGKKINSIPEENRKKFALFELLYGIDYNYAENLIKKYGKNLDQIKARTPEEEFLKKYIEALKSIIELDNSVITQMTQNEDFMNYLQNSEVPEIASSIIIEQDIVKMFAREFDDKIRNSSEPECYEIAFKGETVSVELYSPIKKDGSFIYTEFAIYARQEGAYTEWENPENYNDYFNVQSAMTHGNCESFINQSQIAMARSKGGPKSGYISSGSLMMMAPWDIISANENIKVSPIKAKWNTGRGVEFRTPDELINYTRHGHMETVSDRIEKLDKNGIQKRLPKKTIYIQERHNEDKNKLDAIKKSEWNETLRMAKDMKVSNMIIDREGFAIQEEMVIQHDLELLGGQRVKGLATTEDIERLTGKKCQNVDWSQKPQLSREELIREIIVRFENNAIGMLYADSKDEFFTDEKRKNVVDELMRTIENEKKNNPNQYYKDLETVERIITEEKSKEVTSSGDKVYQVPKVYMELEQEINTILVQDKKREDFVQIGNKDELNKVLEFIYDSKIYDENKIHSSDHIAKTTLFADILAQREGLSKRETSLLLIATAMHDSGREGEDGDKPHSVLSAEKTGKLLSDENSPFKEYDLTEDEIKLIQIAVEYHELDEETPGRLQIVSSMYKRFNGLNDLIKKYELDEKYLSVVSKLCVLLKDADALDRGRFAHIGSSTNTQYLHTESAKDIRMLAFADRLNNQTAYKILQKYYEQEQTSINAVQELNEKRTEKLPEENQRLTIEEMYDAISKMGIDIKGERGIEFLRQQYDEELVGTEDVQSAISRIKQEYERITQQGLSKEGGTRVDG